MDCDTSSGDYGRLERIADAALRELAHAGITETPATIVADAGYWHTEQIQRLMADGIQVLIPPDSDLRAGARPGWDGGLYEFMRRVLAAEHGRTPYSKRKQSIEPTFGQIKGNRRLDRFLRRGRAAVRSEWRLIAASHNLLKLHNHGVQPVTG
jgi:Transposase DDE domain